ncbi:MAG: hypothetical protein DRJ35_04285 [Thermoprotei archaeon]|nr:MAG: hypothetical protein DRJ35_04285 [Thermoprotei archaeon]
MPIERIKTGVPGLDEVLGGGIPKDSLFLIAGPAGAGKTVMCVQMVYHNVKQGKKAVFVSFDEGKKLVEFMKSFGWNLDELIEDGKLELMDFITIKEAGVSDYVNMILQKIEEMQAEIVVIDSLTTLILSLPEPAEARIVIDLLRRLKPPGTTIIATANMSMGSRKIGVGVEEIIADGVLLLKRYFYKGEQRIKLLVLKLRGSQHSKRFHEVLITDKGIEVMTVA